MESLFVSLISVALVIIATVTMSMSLISSATTVTDSWAVIEKTSEQIRRTSISVSPPDTYSGGYIEILAANIGQSSLSQFEKWDVITEYQSGQTDYLTYTTNLSPADNEWTVTGIYMSANMTMQEVFDPNILNSWETARIRLNPSPPLDPGQSLRITVATENGITAQCIVIRY